MARYSRRSSSRATSYRRGRMAGGARRRNNYSGVRRVRRTTARGRQPVVRLVIQQAPQQAMAAPGVPGMIGAAIAPSPRRVF